MPSVFDFFRQFWRPTKEELNDRLFELTFKLYKEKKIGEDSKNARG